MSDRVIDRIRRLYDRTTARTIERDLTRAIELLKTLPDEQTRARAAVYMDGLSQMRSEWRLEAQRTRGRARRSTGPGGTATRPARRTRKKSSG